MAVGRLFHSLSRLFGVLAVVKLILDGMLHVLLSPGHLHRGKLLVRFQLLVIQRDPVHQPGAFVGRSHIGQVRKFFQKCLVCFAITAVFLLLYIALRFKKIGGLSAGVTAIVALLHDILISFCVFVIFGMSINDIFIAVVLTILGYSLNSTIVIYDRVRENKRKMGPRTGTVDIMNLSLNQTLGRTLLTSVTTFLALLVVGIVAGLYGISTVVSFAVPMMAGVVAGCFSSQCIAPNIFAMWQVRKRERMDTAKGRKK